MNIRIEKTKNYTVMSNYHLKDKNQITKEVLITNY